MQLKRDRAGTQSRGVAMSNTWQGSYNGGRISKRSGSPNSRQMLFGNIMTNNEIRGKNIRFSQEIDATYHNTDVNQRINYLTELVRCISGNTAFDRAQAYLDKKQIEMPQMKDQQIPLNIEVGTLEEIMQDELYA